MPTPQKEAVVQEMTDKFSRARSIFVADFTGIDVNTIVELRKGFHAENVEYRVVKNTLAHLALNKAGIKELDDLLVGVNSYVISYDDPTKPMKILKKFKSILNDKFKIKAAVFEGTFVGPDQVEQLANLPSRDELLAQFVGMLQQPLVHFVNTLRAPLLNFVGAVKALEEQKKQSG
ncbi:MAG: 50S ribosomal protein L10 [Calditrichaeota bacterium]|nr:MAG: 50S ribosomal protein L10 [Calditrichota bacterium]